MTGRIAYQGAPGAFGEEACRRFVPDHDPISFPTFAAVVDAVSDGAAALGMLPVENNSFGPVPGSDALLATPGIEIRSEHVLPVRLHLMACPGSRLEEIERVASHPVALGQCRTFLSELGVTTAKASNTAVAAEALSRAADRRQAVIASEPAAQAYHLTILRRDVHDRADNATRFCVVARRRDI